MGFGLYTDRDIFAKQPLNSGCQLSCDFAKLWFWRILKFFRFGQNSILAAFSKRLLDAAQMRFVKRSRLPKIAVKVAGYIFHRNQACGS